MMPTVPWKMKETGDLKEAEMRRKININKKGKGRPLNGNYTLLF